MIYKPTKNGLNFNKIRDLNVLLKMLTEEFMQEQKKIKADPSLNKDQREQ